MCQSACTMVVVHIPRSRLCFGDYSSLNFHQARHDDGSLATTATKWMIDRYPADIQAWITARGGWPSIPTPGMTGPPRSRPLNQFDIMYAAAADRAQPGAARRSNELGIG